MGSRKLVGVVTVTYNSAGVIDDFMQSMLAQAHCEFILYVIDNASPDETMNRISKYKDPRIVIIANERNVGVAEGNNIGIRAALQDGCCSVLLVNNDTVFEPELVSKLLDGLERYKCDMIVPKILYFDEPKKIWCAGGAFRVLRGSAKHFGFNLRDDGRFDQVRKVSYSPTCCMLISAGVFEDIGLMDTKYFVYFDDTDFCLRAHRAGLTLVYLPDSRLYHKVSSIIGHRSHFALLHLTRSHVYYILKNFWRWTALYYLPVCQLHILARCLFTKNRARAFLLAERAFMEGLSLFYGRSSF
jgi:GT2 family glycosyltransferase